MRLGLCCIFREAPVRFASTTAAALARLPRQGALAKLGDLALGNARALEAAVEACSARGIGAFRVSSGILPARTHPQVGWDTSDLPNADEVVAAFRAAGARAAALGVRLSFHPDQFVVLNSLREDVVTASIAELEAQAEIAEWIGADVINIHAGGAFGDPAAALERFERVLPRLSARVRTRLTLENDDRVYTPADLLPICRSAGIPLCYDVHHHRCRADELSLEEATEEAFGTWDREPLFHVSSPRGGWGAPHPSLHHDFIDAADFPSTWLALPITVDVEAKAKELAVARLRRDLGLTVF